MNIRILLVTMLLLSGTALLAQPGEEVDVVKQFNARLAESQKVGVSPELPPLDTSSQNQQYNIEGLPLEVEYLPPRIRPISLRKEKIQDPFNGLVKIGGGYPASLYGEVSYYLQANDQLHLGLDFRHHSANNNANVENQRFANNAFQALGTYYFDQGFAVGAHVDVGLDYRYYYGYDELTKTGGQEITYEREDVRQRFTDIGLGAEIFNDDRTVADFNYKATIDGYFLEDNFNSRETGFLFGAEGTKWMNDNQSIGAVLNVDMSTFNDTVKQSLNNFMLAPAYTYHGGKFRVKAGLSLGFGAGEFGIFPDAEITYNLLGSILRVFVGADGGFRKNNFRSVTDYNPFVLSTMEVRNSRTYRGYGGIGGTIWRIQYKAEVGYKKVDDLALYQADVPQIVAAGTDTFPRFNVLYDTAGIFYIRGTLNIPLLENLTLTGTVAQNFFNMRNEEKPWHLPSLDVMVGARFSAIEDRLKINADFFVQNGVPAFNMMDMEAVNLGALLDLSIGAEYYFAKRFGAFFQVNNLFNNQRERWNYYRSFGINVLGGVSVRF